SMFMFINLLEFCVFLLFFFQCLGNGAGRPCMFPFYYESNWYSECTAIDSPGNRKWCAVETKYDHGQFWGYCPTNCKYTTILIQVFRVISRTWTSKFKY
uniref:Fibronectin type-II domain-containing protein n=1 Tax=Neolamprologus brichardi TaxID=32507 RepID=A0A3Q4GXE3_NEOBR